MTSAILPIIKKIFIASTKPRSRIKSVWRIAKLTSYAGGLAINLYNVCSLSKEKIKELSKNTVNQIDSNNTIAPDNNN